MTHKIVTIIFSVFSSQYRKQKNVLDGRRIDFAPTISSSFQLNPIYLNRGTVKTAKKTKHLRK
jgi:hypothetical protein